MQQRHLQKMAMSGGSGCTDNVFGHSAWRLCLFLFLSVSLPPGALRPARVVLPRIRCLHIPEFHPGYMVTSMRPQTSACLLSGCLISSWNTSNVSRDTRMLLTFSATMRHQPRISRTVG